MAKEIMYRGKSEEELKKMNLQEFSKLLKSRPRRALARQSQVVEKLITRFEKKEKKNKPLKTHCRDIVIVPQMIGKEIQIHNGKMFFPVQITIEMLGHRLGEFAHTRGKVTHTSMGVGATKSSKTVGRK